MKLTIQTFRADNNDFAAACNGESGPTGWGRGGSARDAAVHSVANYFGRGEATGTLLGDAPTPARVIADSASILDRLTSACGQDPHPTLSMTYTDASNRTTVRDIVPLRIEERQRPFNEPYLIALDVVKDEPRTFRVSNISNLSPAL